VKRLLTVCALLTLSLLPAALPVSAAARTYRNPMDIVIPGGGRVKS
jgi:hypothetical protein